MRERSIEVLVDAGSSAVRVVIVEIGGNADVELLGVGCAEGSGFRCGVIVDMDKFCDTLNRAIDEAEANAGLKINNAWFSIGSEVLSSNKSAKITVRQQRITSEDMTQLLHNAAMTVSDDRHQLIHALRQQYIVDEYSGILQPKGMIADQLQICVHTIQARQSDIGNLRLCSEQAGIEVNGFVFGGLAAALSVMSEDERQLGSCVVDIGAGTMNLTAWYQSRAIFSATLPIGGEYASSDLAQLLKLPRAYAETLKCSKGSLNKADDRGEVSVLSTGLREQKYIARSEVNEILRQRYREMLELLMQVLQRSGCLSCLYAGLTLTGGAARLTGLENFARDITNMPVRVAHASNINGLEQYNAQHCYAVISGMAELLTGSYEDGAWASPEKQGIITRLKSFFQRN